VHGTWQLEAAQNVFNKEPTSADEAANTTGTAPERGEKEKGKTVRYQLLSYPHKL